MKTAYIVQGVGESTGCRFLTKFLIQLGVYGSAEHSQEFQRFMYNDAIFSEYVKSNKLKSLVVRQSYPHGTALPSLYAWHRRLKTAGFDKIYIILSTRSWPAQLISTEKNGHCKNSYISDYPTAMDRMQQAYLHIFSDLNRIDNGNYRDFVCVNLGDLSTNPIDNLSFMFKFINLAVPDDFDYSIVKPDIDKVRLKQFSNEYIWQK